VRRFVDDDDRRESSKSFPDEFLQLLNSFLRTLFCSVGVLLKLKLTHFFNCSALFVYFVLLCMNLAPR
jgi:hypothetical protein